MNLLSVALFILSNYSYSDTILPPSQVKPHYHFDTLKGKTITADFSTRYNEGERDIILAINRISGSEIGKAKVLVMPDTLLPQMLNYSPYPDTLPGFDSLLKIILISLRIQAFAIYENGKMTRWGPVSSGKKSTPTPNGLFHTNFKAKVKISSENSSWVMPWYFNFYARRGIAMHQYVLPGYPASHACIRLQEKDAKWIFDWAEQWKVSTRSGSILSLGTPVIIFGEYNFDKPQPWLDLPNNKESVLLSIKELQEISSYLPVINKDVVLKKADK